jgi:hypothetical protein
MGKQLGCLEAWTLGGLKTIGSGREAMGITGSGDYGLRVMGKRLRGTGKE